MQDVIDEVDTQQIIYNNENSQAQILNLKLNIIN